MVLLWFHGTFVKYLFAIFERFLKCTCFHSQIFIAIFRFRAYLVHCCIVWAQHNNTVNHRLHGCFPDDWLNLHRPQTIVVRSEMLIITWGLDIFRCNETNDLWGHRKCLKAREECTPPPVNTAECEERLLTGQTALEWNHLTHVALIDFWSIIWLRLKQGWFLQLHPFNGLFSSSLYSNTAFTTNNKNTQTFIL